jgi:hypothetical protein
LLAGLPARASAVPWKLEDEDSTKKIVEVSAGDDGVAMRRSLDREVRLHPDDFIVFVTGAEAHRFLVEHRDDVQRETNERMVARGVVGYWQGKTLVVLPLEWEKSSQ